jgi:methionyl aminopeptidase
MLRGRSVLRDNVSLDFYRRAGNITARLRSEVPDLVYEGMKVIDLCEKVEERIFKMGGRPAFPCNIGIGSVAAHYTSPLGDSSTIPIGSIVKVDFGVEVSGYVADSAITVSLSPEYQPMIVAAEEALKSAVENVRSGVKARDIGAVIERHIAKYGYKPIRNLTGHKIERYSLHTGKAIPNVSDIDGSILEEGEVYAIEPFVTSIDANGTVEDGEGSYIFKLHKEKGAKSMEAKRLLGYIMKEYRTLPFAYRWLEKSYTRGSLQTAMNELLTLRCVTSYPVLVESTGKPVAQAEHTVIVEAQGCEVLTG